jgi:hypothetical protein
MQITLNIRPRFIEVVGSKQEAIARATSGFCYSSAGYRAPGSKPITRTGYKSMRCDRWIGLTLTKHKKKVKVLSTTYKTTKGVSKNRKVISPAKWVVGIYDIPDGFSFDQGSRTFTLTQPK